MDETDKTILKILQKNCKIKYQDIAKELNIAASTVHSRVKKLESEKIIKNFGAIVDHEKVGIHTIAWLGISVEAQKMVSVAEKLATFNEVQLVATSSGDHDVVAQILATNEKELWRFINNSVKTIDGIGQMDVSSFIDIYKMTHFINLT